MDTAFEAKLVKALELISATANEAWWQHHSSHCGSDFGPTSCAPCFAYEQCKRNEALIALFAEFQGAVG